ncbi:MAG TPA: TIGR03089 family protein, partial [Angustibacter sp.]|nr:TIGR03089 family protein [Angustibacter sp.]
MNRLASLPVTLASTDPTRPRLTWYDDADGPTRGERIELSGRVIANWVAKAANLLVDELGVERGDVVVLDLPTHWRAVYWALAAWRVGAVVSPEPDARAVVVVTDRPQQTPIAPGARVVAVSLPALARSWAGRALDGAVDEATDLLGQPDAFEPFDEPDDGDDALAVE